jgi:uncharacterized peroxidase-related enzyme
MFGCMTTTFEIHTPQTAPEQSRAALEGLQKEVGFLPNLAATMGNSPTLIDSFTTVRKILAQGSLSGVERETISLLVSRENGCTYCMAAHSTFAKMQGMSAGALAALRDGEVPDEPRLASLAAYTRELLRRQGHASDRDLQAFLEAGFTRAQALEVVAVIGFTTWASYAHNIAQVPVDPPFASQTWTPPKKP